MALALLDGSTAAVDFTTGVSPVSWKCIISYMSVDFGRRLEQRTTFCTVGQWESGVPVSMQGSIRLDGFVSTGLTISDPLTLFASTAALPFVATFHTGCTLTGNMHAVGRHDGIRAKGAADMGTSAVTDGPVTSAWVTV